MASAVAQRQQPVRADPGKEPAVPATASVASGQPSASPLKAANLPSVNVRRYLHSEPVAAPRIMFVRIVPLGLVVPRRGIVVRRLLIAG